MQFTRAVCLPPRLQAAGRSGWEKRVARYATAGMPE